MAFNTTLDEALEAWQYTRGGVISEIKNLPDVSLTFRPTSTARTPAEIAIHIVESGLMMAGELSRPDGDFSRKSFPQFMKEYARGIKPTTNKKQLVQLLTKTQADGAQKIAKAGHLHMLQLITRFDGAPGHAPRVDESRDLARGIPSRPARPVRAARRPRAGAHAVDLRKETR